MVANLNPAFVWLLAGLILLGLEVLAPGVFMMWLGIAALVTGLIALGVQLNFGLQVAIFAIFSAISLMIGLRLRQPAAPGLNTQQAGLSGRIAVVLHFDGREGRVRVGDSDWSARIAEGVPLPEPGARLRVFAVDGTVLLVRPEA